MHQWNRTLWTRKENSSETGMDDGCGHHSSVSDGMVLLFFFQYNYGGHSQWTGWLFCHFLVHAGSFHVSVIHQTLTWTTGICLRIHGGWLHTLTATAQHFLLGKTQVFLVLLARFEPQVIKSWVWRSTNWATPSPLLSTKILLGLLVKPVLCVMVLFFFLCVQYFGEWIMDCLIFCFFFFCWVYVVLL